MIMEMVQQSIVDSISNILSVENNAGWTELQKVKLCLHTTGRNVLLVRICMNNVLRENINIMHV